MAVSLPMVWAHNSVSVFFLIACLTGIDGKFRKSGSGP